MKINKNVYWLLAVSALSIHTLTAKNDVQMASFSADIHSRNPASEEEVKPADKPAEKPVVKPEADQVTCKKEVNKENPQKRIEELLADNKAALKKLEDLEARLKKLDKPDNSEKPAKPNQRKIGQSQDDSMNTLLYMTSLMSQQMQEQSNMQMQMFSIFMQAQTNQISPYSSIVDQFSSNLYSRRSSWINRLDSDYYDVGLRYDSSPYYHPYSAFYRSPSSSYDIYSPSFDNSSLPQQPTGNLNGNNSFSFLPELQRQYTGVENIKIGKAVPFKF